MRFDWEKWVHDSLRSGASEMSILEVAIGTGRYSFDVAMNTIRAKKSVIALESSRFRQQMSSEGYALFGPNAPYKILYKSFLPEVMLVEGVLSDEECEHLIDEGGKDLKRSTVVGGESAVESIESQVRTSHGAFLKPAQTEIIKRVEERLLGFARWQPERSEGIQVLRYQPGGEYKEHFDYFDNNAAGEGHKRRGGQRVATFIMYLNDVEAGGATHFPYTSAVFVPKKGSVLFFAYNNIRGETDLQTLHAGLPVIKGEKWIATKWLREAEFS